MESLRAVLDSAPTGRARCRGCGQPIAKGERRLGDVFMSPFADGAETTHWYHPPCGAFKRPTVLLTALAQAAPTPEEQALAAVAQRGIEHRRLSRIDGAERAPSARAGCRHCKQKIDRGAWRIRLVWFEDGRFEPSGFVHAACARTYFESDQLLGPVQHFSPGLLPADVAELATLFAS